MNAIRPAILFCALAVTGCPTEPAPLEEQTEDPALCAVSSIDPKTNRASILERATTVFKSPAQTGCAEAEEHLVSIALAQDMFESVDLSIDETGGEP